MYYFPRPFNVCLVFSVGKVYEFREHQLSRQWSQAAILTQSNQGDSPSDQKKILVFEETAFIGAPYTVVDGAKLAGTYLANALHYSI